MRLDASPLRVRVASQTRRIGAPTLFAAFALASAACAPGGLQSTTLVNSVRILASQADPPYAAPGTPVTVQVLAVDERPNKPEPMQLYWLPSVCMNPASDAYYYCFAGLGLGEGGAPDGGGEAPAMGMVSMPAMSAPDTYGFGFTMPAEAIVDHSVTPAPPIPYGLAILFNIACAGHIEPVMLDPNNVQSPPIGCFDSQENRLGPNDYVIGFTRVYAYDPARATNANPAIDHIDQDGAPVDLQLGISMAACGSSCKSIHIGPVVTPDQQQMNPEEVDMNGNPLKEQIYANFYTTMGSFSNDARLLYDATTGSVGSTNDTDNQFTPPSMPGDGTMWIVVHDNRGGASWVSIPLHFT